MILDHLHCGFVEFTFVQPTFFFYLSPQNRVAFLQLFLVSLLHVCYGALHLKHLCLHRLLLLLCQLRSLPEFVLTRCGFGGRSGRSPSGQEVSQSPGLRPQRPDS